MKYIKSLTVLLMSLLIFNSCESTTVDFDTNLKTTIVAEVDAPQTVAIELKATAGYPFSASQKLHIQDNSKVNDYIDRLKEMNVKSITATFTGIEEGETLTELNISIESVALDVTLQNVTEGQSITLDVSATVLNAISDLLIEEKEITISISGYSTFAPMTFNTLMDFAVTISAKVLD
jgi:hypothetical protein